MPLDSTVTYDQDPPRRPTIDDLNGGALENDTAEPPAVGVDPDARAMNQSDRQVVALGNVSQCARIEVHFTAGVPSISGIWGLPTGLEADDFNVTDNGNGDTSITHTGGLLPAAQWSSSVTLCADVEIDRFRAYSITNGWRVKTKLGATGTDCNFVLHISGL